MAVRYGKDIKYEVEAVFNVPVAYLPACPPILRRLVLKTGLNRRLIDWNRTGSGVF